MTPSILIIEPDADAATITRAGVERSGAGGPRQVQVMSSVAWPLPGGRPPDVLIIDPTPYALRGVRLIQQVREDSPSTRILVLASAAPPSLRAMLLELGVDAYFDKGTGLPQVLAQLNKMLESHPGASNGNGNGVEKPQ